MVIYFSTLYLTQNKLPKIKPLLLTVSRVCGKNAIGKNAIGKNARGKNAIGKNWIRLDASD